MSLYLPCILVLIKRKKGWDKKRQIRKETSNNEEKRQDWRVFVVKECMRVGEDGPMFPTGKVVFSV